MTDALRRTDPDRTVPACPGWSVADLTAHLTAVHRWVVGALRNEGSPGFELTAATPDDYAAAGAALLARLDELAPDAPCWTFNKYDQTAGFWRRRQLQEVAVHRWDVERHELDPAVAAAGIDEVVEFFLPRQVSLGRATVPPGRVLLAAPERQWTLVDSPGPEATVHGSAADLDLLLWGRLALDQVSVTGDAAFARAAFDAALTP